MRELGGFLLDAKLAVTSCAFVDREAVATGNEESASGPPFVIANPFSSKGEGATSSGGTSAGGGGAIETYEVAWTFSGTWPLPWRPRVRVSGTCTVTTSRDGAGGGGGGVRRVLSLEDRWAAPAGGLPGLLAEQVVPRALDLLNVYASPHSERVPWRVLESREGYAVVETVPQAVLVATVDLDPQASAAEEARLQGTFLPDHAFAEPLRFKGKFGDAYLATSPLSSTVESIGGGEAGSPLSAGARRVSWTVPIPTQLCPGLDPWGCLPALSEPSAEDAGPCRGATLAYAVQPARRLAVAPFGLDDTVSEAAAAARRALLNAMRRDGLRPTTSEASGKPRFEMIQHSTKLGWSPKTRAFHMGIYPSTPDLFPKPHAVAAEIAD